MSLDAIAAAPVGVLGLTAKDLTPRAVAVTPYVIDGRVTITTTLALLTKAKMLRNRPAAAVYAGGMHVSGDVTLAMHRDSTWFDEYLRGPESEKYPPAKSLLAVPFHRRVLWWYVGRVSMTFGDPTIEAHPGSDRATITSVVDGEVRITPLDPNVAADGDEIELGADVPDGAGCLLLHHETEGMAELLALTLRGTVRNGVLRVEHRAGSLEPEYPSTRQQLKDLRTLSAQGKANRSTIDAWGDAQ